METTGLVAGRDRVVEIAVVRTNGYGQVVDEWTTLINPDGPVGATRIHGITAADVRRAPRFADVVAELTARFAGRALVAHNARFDLGFLSIEFARAGWTMPTVPYLCTLDASWAYLSHLARRRLSDCCWASGISLDEAHSALGDARATAALLAYYLHPSRPPVPEHLNLPVSAAYIVWPNVPITTVAPARRTARPLVIPAAPGRLAALLDDLPLSAAVEEGAPEDATGYLELLAEVLEDGVLTDAEACALTEVANLYALTREQVEAAHRAFLLALAHKVVEDGKVTHDERDDLLATAAVLGFPDALVKAVLDEARAAILAHRSLTCKPLPAAWRHGQPLRVGQAVAFTGCDELQRARVEGRAQVAGLRVTGSVSRQTVALVTDGADPRTGKAVAARQLGTRIVTPMVFAEMVEHVQPALPEPPPAPTVAPQRTPGSPARRGHLPPATQTSPAEQDPAAIRAWARRQGLPVGVRGRLPADVCEAYRAAHDPAETGHPGVIAAPPQ